MSSKKNLNQNLSTFIIPNPRWLKQLINKLNYLSDLIIEENLDINIFIKLLILRDRWIDLFNAALLWIKLNDPDQKTSIYDYLKSIQFNFSFEMTEFINVDPSLNKPSKKFELKRYIELISLTNIIT